MIDYNPTELVNPNIQYKNRCRQYLLPSLLLLKSWKAFNRINPQDITAITTSMNGNLYVFIKSKNFLKDLIEELKNNNELIDEYIYSRTIHIVVVRPDINYTAFLEGEYSKIYTKDQLKICFRPESKSYKILTKDQSYFLEYFKFIKKQFGDVRESSVKEHKEYDIPPCLNQEIMSYD